MQPAQKRLSDLALNSPGVQLLSRQILIWQTVIGSIADNTDATLVSGGIFIGDAIRTLKGRAWPALSSRVPGCLQELPVLELSSGYAYHCARC